MFPVFLIAKIEVILLSANIYKGKNIHVLDFFKCNKFIPKYRNYPVLTQNKLTV